MSDPNWDTPERFEYLKGLEDAKQPVQEAPGIMTRVLTPYEHDDVVHALTSKNVIPMNLTTPEKKAKRQNFYEVKRVVSVITSTEVTSVILSVRHWFFEGHEDNIDLHYSFKRLASDSLFMRVSRI